MQNSFKTKSGMNIFSSGHGHLDIVINLRLPQKTGNFFTGWVTIIFSNRARHRFLVVFVLHVDGVKLCLWTATTSGPIVYLSRWYMSMNCGGIILTGGNRKTWINSVQVPLCTPQISHGLTDPRANPGIHCERLTTNRLSHGKSCYIFCNYRTNIK
jgi:hypothetical protein